MNYRSDIDALRALSVIAVILFHLDIALFSGGFVGVDVFLVISGYLITNKIFKEISKTGTFSFKNFYISRILRLLPAFLATAFFTTILAVFFFSPTHLKNYGHSLTYSLFSWSNNFFLKTIDYFSTSSKMMPLLHTWSLSLEEQFYLIWPILLLLISQLKSNKLRFLSLAIIGFLSFSLNLAFQDSSPLAFLPHIFDKGNSTIFYMLPFRVFEFILGGIIPFIPKLKQRYKNDFFYGIGLTFILISIFIYDEGTTFPSWAALLPTLGAMLAIWSGENSKVSKLLAPAPIVRIGLLSYSLYLVHWPLIAFWNYYLVKKDISSYIILFILTFFFAYLLNTFVEKPMRVKNFSYLSRTKRIIFTTTFILLVCLGLSFKSHNGWDFRSGNDFRNSQFSTTSFHRKFYGGNGTPRRGYVKKGKREIILIGDSHARQYARGIKEITLQNNPDLGLYVHRYACDYIRYFKILSEGQPPAALCASTIVELQKILSKANDPIVVFTLSYMKKVRLLYKLSEYGDDLENVEFLATGLKKFKKILNIKKLVVIGQVPTTHGYELYDLLTRPSWLNTNIEDLRYKKIFGDVRLINSTLDKGLMGQENIDFINPESVLCKANDCLNIDENNQLLYSDSNHLSIIGSKYFILNSNFESLVL